MIIRRLIDLGERTQKDKGKNVSLVFLDWEKAFDKVDQDSIFETMERFGVEPKLINLTKELYKNPKFRVEMGDETSSWKTQETGIRQGCTLSPYLFILLMSAILWDVHDDEVLEKELKQLDRQTMILMRFFMLTIPFYSRRTRHV